MSHQEEQHYLVFQSKALAHRHLGWARHTVHTPPWEEKVIFFFFFKRLWGCSNFVVLWYFVAGQTWRLLDSGWQWRSVKPQGSSTKWRTLFASACAGPGLEGRDPWQQGEPCCRAHILSAGAGEGQGRARTFTWGWGGRGSPDPRQGRREKPQGRSCQWPVPALHFASEKPGNVCLDLDKQLS